MFGIGVFKREGGNMLTLNCYDLNILTPTLLTLVIKLVLK